MPVTVTDHEGVEHRHALAELPVAEPDGRLHVAVESGRTLAVYPANAWRRAVVDEEPVEPVEDLAQQVQRLGQYIVDHVPGEPSRSEGAIDCAIRVLGEQQAALASMRGKRDRARDHAVRNEWERDAAREHADRLDEARVAALQRADELEARLLQQQQATETLRGHLDAERAEGLDPTVQRPDRSLLAGGHMPGAPIPSEPGLRPVAEEPRRPRLDYFPADALLLTYPEVRRLLALHLEQCGADDAARAMRDGETPLRLSEVLGS